MFKFLQMSPTQALEHLLSIFLNLLAAMLATPLVVSIVSSWGGRVRRHL